VEPGEAQLHLRLDPQRPNDSEIAGGSDRGLEEGGFPDASLAPKNECPTKSVADGVEQVVERRLLASSINEAWAVYSSDRANRCAR
jgi:hypothetical protein